MAVQDYQVTTAGAKRILHNGLTAHAGRKLALDPTAEATKRALAAGFISATVTAPNYEGDAALLQTYTVSNGRKVTHNGTTLTGGQTVQLDPADDHTADLLAVGAIH